MDTYLFFFAAFSFLLTHEMDAVRLHEWKIFPILSTMTEERGYICFTALHIPLYIILLWGLFMNAAINQRVVIGLDSFCIIHVVLHVILRNHSHNHFQSWFSWTLILGAGIAAGIDLLIHL